MLTSGQTTTTFLFLCLFLSLWWRKSSCPQWPWSTPALCNTLQRKRRPKGRGPCRGVHAHLWPMHVHALVICLPLCRLRSLPVWPKRSRKPGSWSRLEPGKGRGCGWTPRPRIRAQQELSESASGHARPHCGAKPKLLRVHKSLPRGNETGIYGVNISLRRSPGSLNKHKQQRDINQICQADKKIDNKMKRQTCKITLAYLLSERPKRRWHVWARIA